MIKLKDEYMDTLIYIPVEKRDTIGRFIDVRLYPYLQKKYPDLFEIVVDQKNKKSQKNDIRVDDSKQFGGDNITSEQDFFGQ